MLVFLLEEKENRQERPTYIERREKNERGFIGEGL